MTHIEGTQKEEGGLQASGEDEAEDSDDDEGTDAQRLGHDDDNDQGCQDTHPQQSRQVGVQHTCGGGRPPVSLPAVYMVKCKTHVAA